LPPANLLKSVLSNNLLGSFVTKSKEEEQTNTGDEASAKNRAAAEEEASEPRRLSKSNRLKGYLALLVFSCINLNSSIDSKEVDFPPSKSQRRYAISVATVSVIITSIVVLMHLDRITPLAKLWRNFFGPQKKVELYLLVFLVIWWGLATWFNTSAGGIACEGSDQLNIFFSTWICLIICFWTVERYRKASGQTSTEDFLNQMPGCTSAWVAAVLANTFVLTFSMRLKNYVLSLDATTVNPTIADVYLDNPPASYQWELIAVVSSLSILFGMIFVLIELFRSGKKGKWESIVEGIILCTLTVAWIPTVTIVTVPGGIAEIIGNTYIWSWASTVTVLRTFSKWIRAWRESIHDMIERQVIEYEQAKRQALRRRTEANKTENDERIQRNSPKVDNALHRNKLSPSVVEQSQDSKD